MKTKTMIFLLTALFFSSLIIIQFGCEKDEDNNPNVSFTITPSTGTTNTLFEFDASSCTGNNDSSYYLEVRWGWENDGVWDTQFSWTKTATHQYSQEGTYTIKLEVKDSDGMNDFTTHSLSVTKGGSGSGCGGITQIEYQGQIYEVVEIGNQCWMAENLNIGTMINGSENMTDNGVIEKYCYDNSSANCNIYGGMYQWDEIMQYTTTQGAQGICPVGWHIPADNEWTTLIDYLGGEYVAGGKMKENGTVHWNSPNTGATNESGFTAIPGGRNTSGNFSKLTIGAYFHSSSGDANSAWFRSIYFDEEYVSRYAIDKNFGVSVRCLKD